MADLELESEQIERMGKRVMEFITRYLTIVGDDPVVPPGLSPARLRDLLREPLPRDPQGVDAALDDAFQKVASWSVRVGHPRFLAWIRTSPLAAAIYAEALAAVLNQSVAVWEGAPAASEVERLVLDWLKEMSGYPLSAGGVLTSGGSMANFTCLLAARQAADPQVRERGLAGAPPFTLYLTQETHYSVVKAAEMMGLGRRALRFIPTDAQWRMDAAALKDRIRADRAAGYRPLAVVATLGTVNTGACDDLESVGAVCRAEGVWLHVDGAYGGMVNLVPEKQYLARGLEMADSFAFDPHKTLFIPFEAGCALVRDAETLRAAFHTPTDYLPNSAPDAPINFRDYGPQLSRSFRALKIYLTLKTYGVDALAQALAAEYALAEAFVRRLEAAPDFEVLAPAPLGIVAFRYHPPQVDDPARLDEINRALAFRLRRRGRVFLSDTLIDRQVALRACFVSHRTRETDLDVVLEEIRAAVAVQEGKEPSSSASRQRGSDR